MTSMTVIMCKEDQEHIIINISRLGMLPKFVGCISTFGFSNGALAFWLGTSQTSQAISRTLRKRVTLEPHLHISDSTESTSFHVVFHVVFHVARCVLWRHRRAHGAYDLPGDCVLLEGLMVGFTWGFPHWQNKTWAFSKVPGMLVTGKCTIWGGFLAGIGNTYTGMFGTFAERVSPQDEVPFLFRRSAKWLKNYPGKVFWNNRQLRLSR